MSTDSVDLAGAQCPNCESPCVRATLAPSASKWTPTECNACGWSKSRSGNGGVSDV